MSNPDANPSATYEFTIGQLVLNAYRFASLMGAEEPAEGVQWQKRLIFGQQCLEMVTKGVEAEGKVVRARKFVYVTLVAGQYEYSLDPSLMDVYGDGAFIPVGEPLVGANGETPVKPVDMETFQRISAFGATGRPVWFFPYRATEPITVRLWPTPDSSNAGTIRFQMYRFLGQSDDATKSADLERYWASYLVYATAAMLAEAANLPADKVMRLEAKAAELLVRAKSYSHQRFPGTVVMTHRGSARRYG